MAETVFRGPAYSAGAMEDGRVESMDGPGIEYQANCFPDIRFTPTRKDGMYPGRVQCFLNSPFTVLTDNIPSANGTATIAALANVVNGTPMTLVSVAPGSSTAGVPSMATVPLVPFGSSTPVSVLAMDFGFTTGTTVASSATITVPDSTQFSPGEWICIGGVGNSAKTASLFTQVISLASSTTITVSASRVPQASLTGAPIGRTNLTMGALAPPQAYPAGIPQLPSGVYPYNTAGLALILNPVEAITRGLSVTGSTSGVGGAFIVRGYDIYGVAHAEQITATAGATTAYGKTAFKYIASITPQFTDAHNYSFGTSDVYGFNIRSDKWEFVNEFWNGAFATSSAGWVQALQPPSGPATATSADVRGTFQASSIGGGSSFGGTASNGTTIRLMLAMTIPLYNDIFGTPNNQPPIFGLPQFTE